MRHGRSCAHIERAGKSMKRSVILTALRVEYQAVRAPPPHAPRAPAESNFLSASQPNMKSISTILAVASLAALISLQAQAQSPAPDGTPAAGGAAAAPAAAAAPGARAGGARRGGGAGVESGPGSN